MKRLLLVLLLLSSLALAQGTRAWKQDSFDDFEKGTADGVALRSAGSMELAPAFKVLYTSPSTFLWSAASDAQGNVYVAAGSPARVYKVTPAGAATVIFAPKELQVQAVAVDKSGVVYAGTSPDGKVYRVVPNGRGEEKRSKPAEKNGKENAPPAAADAQAEYTASVLFDPQTKYIWDLALDQAGDLYVATGDRGEIFRVTPKGDGAIFFKSDEAHIRVLAIDNKDNLIAGSDGSGLVYRISPAGEAFVLYSAPKKEITALALDKAGNIYAAGVGEKRGGGAPMVMPPAPVTGPGGFTFSANATANPQAPAAGNPPAGGVPPLAIPVIGATSGAEIYQIAPDGSPRRVWSSRDDLVYALAFDSKGRLLAGTGNRGHVYQIQNNGDYTDLLKASATQVTAFAPAPQGGLYAATSNLGKVFLLGAGPQSEGTYESDVFDARTFSRWGRVEYRGMGNVELYARSGNVDNPDRNWSPWQRVDLAKDAPLEIPPARFVQWRAVLKPGDKPAVLDSVALNYRSKNVAPEVDDVAVQVGARFQAVAVAATSADSGPIQVGGTAAAATGVPKADYAPPAYRDPDYLAMRWTAHDDNDDDLVYSVYFRGDGEKNWKLLKDGLTDKYYSTETALFPDGGYTVKVVASDAPSHSPDDALGGEAESARFEIDTTPPVIADLAASNDGGALHIVFRAQDSFSPVRRAEYSVDAGDWQFVEPVGLLSDAKTENYDFSVPLPAPPNDPAARKQARDTSEHVVVVRVYDRYSNMATAKTVVRAK
jgi:sugar lactone lactonase YvrE